MGTRLLPPAGALVAAGLALVGAVVLVAPATGHVLVLESGARLEVREAPVFDVAGWAPVTTPDGRTFLIERSAINASSTEALNRRRTEPRGEAPKKVWTAADLARLRGGNVSVVGTSGAEGSVPAAAASSPSAPDEDAAPAESESEWRAAALALRQRIAALERQVEWLDRVDASWEGYVLGTGSFQGPIASASASKIAETRRRRAEAEAGLQQARGELSRLEDRARRARVPPGWLRPE